MGVGGGGGEAREGRRGPAMTHKIVWSQEDASDAANCQQSLGSVENITGPPHPPTCRAHSLSFLRPELG